MKRLYSRLLCALASVSVGVISTAWNPAWAKEPASTARSGSPEGVQANQEPPALTIVSYNTHGGIGIDGKYDLRRIASVIAHAHADIVGLQEVGAYWHSHALTDNEAEYYLKRLHMYSFFAPIYDRDARNPGEPRRQYGVLLLSRYPMVAVHNHRITRLRTVHSHPVASIEPGFAEALVRVHGRGLHVYLTHLDYRHNPKIRERQVAEMMRVTAQDPAPQVLMGDLNATPGAPELKPLWTRYRNAMAACRGQYATYPADAPRLAIDYVLVSPDVGVQSAEVLNSQASDHRPVRVRISLPATQHQRTAQ
jgi:endonuclease/exonuclease/phosphatase family metal-dependent hydrolase